MKEWELQRTTQCAKCPWRKSTDPREIPNGYSEELHRALASTIAEQGTLHATVHVMACHEEHEAHCIGWLKQQIGPGNNIPMRIAMMTCTNARDIRTIGPQHQTFEETLPE